MKKAIFNNTEITFDDLEFSRLSDEGHFECRGEDSEGNLYSGVIQKSCGEYGDIVDIELIKEAKNRADLTFDSDPPIDCYPYEY